MDKMMRYVNLADIEWKPCPLHGYCGKDCMECNLPTVSKGQLEKLADAQARVIEDEPLADVIERKEISKLEAKIFNATADKYFMPTKLLSCDEITEIIKEWEGECNGKSE